MIPRGAPTVEAVPQYEKVSTFFAKKLIDEINVFGDIIHPKTIGKYHKLNNKCGKGGMKLNFKNRKYFLDLQTERSDRPNYNNKLNCLITFCSSKGCCENVHSAGALKASVPTSSNLQWF